VDDPQTPLLYVLRNQLQLKAAKFGCGMAQCGACTVIIDGRAERSCVRPVSTVGPAHIRTLEGLAHGLGPDPLQQSFIDHQAAQCGYCTNGMVMASRALLDARPNPTEAEVRSALQGNLCRCGTHPRVVQAVLAAATAKVG
jgi:nicotinate dehydrogenase subunit A